MINPLIHKGWLFVEPLLAFEVQWFLDAPQWSSYLIDGNFVE